ncbi:sensor histidine kinase [Candidatus Marithrix sp. Canyon 246]|uniref:sensor histidine kinase n=1 Tax=Candidatus Marithrix sp. Canyon 246 TaxID=1827136 RepID=UPI00084A01F8|nr:ATP-binding protein [Candidatus Marithrix sp. Canyon 246]
MKKFFFNIKLSLKSVIIVPFILQIVTTVGLVAWLSFYNGKQAIEDLAIQLRSEITALIDQHIKTHTAMPHLVNQINSDAIRQDLLKIDFSNPQHLVSYFWNQIKQFKTVSYIGLGTEQGNYIGSKKRENGSIIVELSNHNKLETWETDTDGNRSTVSAIRQNYDPRTRPWYKAAVNAAKPVWSDIYVYFSSNSTGISANQAIYDKKGKLLAVASVDLTFLDLGYFLKNLKIAKTGQTFIMEPSGLLVASSTDEKPFRIIDNKTRRFRAIDSEDILTSATAKYLEGKLNNTKKQQLDFIYQQKKYFLEVLPYHDKWGLEWLIVVIVPENDFMEHIHFNTLVSIMLCVFALIVAILIGIVTARWIIKPIQNLNIASKALALGQWDQKVQIERQDELGDLAKSFNSMAQQLTELLYGLEAEVEERTKKIKQAQQQLIESAKMAELGNLVAGVAHEINTPVGIGVTAASRLNTLSLELENLYKTGKMKRADLDKYLKSTQQGSQLIQKNLTRAAELVQSFKQVAVDQSSEQQRSFVFKDYLNEIITSLRAELKHYQVKVSIICDENIVLTSYPGIFYQIFTNLIMNSLIHGFSNQQQGEIKIKVKSMKQGLILDYSDNGKGIPAKVIEHIFEPFFTTNRQQGGSGLGLHIVYNLVTHKLNGNISCDSSEGNGVNFIIEIKRINNEYSL